MKSIKYLLAVLVLSWLSPFSSAKASVDTSRLYSADGIINVVVLLAVLICMIWSAKVMTLVKGGLLSRSWQMFSLGFGFLLVARVLLLGESISAFYMPNYIMTVLYSLMIFTWLIGLNKAKNVLG
jgi:hypothetical protein